MFEVGELVKIVESPFFMGGKKIPGSSNEAMLDKIGIVVEKEPNIYLISVTREDGVTVSYYYYDHELERVE